VLEEAARPDGDWFYVDCGEQPVGPVAPDALAAAAVQGAQSGRAASPPSCCVLTPLARD